MTFSTLKPELPGKSAPWIYRTPIKKLIFKNFGATNELDNAGNLNLNEGL